MSYPDSTTVGTFHQFHAINVGPISPVYEKITKEQLQILEFAENGNAEGIRKMAHDIRYLTSRSLIKPTIINCTDENGWTPLMLAIRRKHPECVSALYQAGARTHTLFDHGSIQLSYWQRRKRVRVESTHVRCD